MKKVFICLALIITAFWGTDFPYDEQQKALKEAIQRYGEAAIDSIEEKTKEKVKRDACQKYLDKADEILDKADKKITNNSTASGGDYSVYASALMKRYEICLSKKVQ